MLCCSSHYQAAGSGNRYTTAFTVPHDFKIVQYALATHELVRIVHVAACTHD
jgi:hypothetical protein